MLGETSTELYEHFNLLVIALIFLGVSSWVAWRLNFYSFPQTDKRVSIHLGDLLGAFLVFLSTVLVIGPLISYTILSVKEGHLHELGQHIDSHTDNLLNLLVIVMVAIGLWLYTRLLSANNRHLLWGGGKKRAFHNYAIGALCWLISFPAVIALGQLISIIFLYLGLPVSQHEQVAVKTLKMTANDPEIFFIMSILIVFIVPMIEETLFRGYLQNWMRRYLSPFKAIVITSIIFALFHYSSTQGLDNIELLSSLFVLSCFLGFVYEKQQSLWASIGLHSTFNAISVIAIFNEGSIF